jgi:hypothetical protein
MNAQDFTNCLTYLTARKSSVWIEVEMRHKDKPRFDKRYSEETGFGVPSNSDKYPYYVWSADADPDDKWGIELRLYFISDGNIPAPLDRIAKDNSRPGYETYNRRINNNEFIWQLFQNGFKLGNN